MSVAARIRLSGLAVCALAVLLPGFAGCASSRSRAGGDRGASAKLQSTSGEAAQGEGSSAELGLVSYDDPDAPSPTGEVTESAQPPLAQQASEGGIPGPNAAPPPPVEDVPPPEPLARIDNPSPQLRDVVSSIHATFPLLQAAYQERGIAAGEQTAAWGAFDTKLKGSSENQPLAYYENYRHAAGLSQPLYGGGDLFGGYRIGRGEFEPWYLERQTNEGGEFKAGVRVPLLKDRQIDARRAALWRATYDRQRAEPEIRSQLILFVADGSMAYWQWVAAGLQYQVGERALRLARQRNEQLRRKVEVGDVDPPVLQDNLRAIAQREAKLIDLRRKLEQTAIKLSLFYRSPDGEPLIPEELPSAGFPDPIRINSSQLEADITAALSTRPEIASLDLLARRIRVDLNEARNEMLPAVDAQLTGSQDVGAPTSSKRDKSPLEMEASLYMDMPLQRRKGQGKMDAARAKLAQLSAKRRFVEDKIAVEIQSGFAALEAAYDRLGKARESVRLAEYMADVERRKFDVGETDLLSVVLREQIAIEAAESEIDALLEYFTASAGYDAALARDWPGRP